MKFFFLLGIVIPAMAFSQNTFPTGAGTNVGIGTMSPSARLEVSSGTSGVSGVKLRDLTSSSATTSANGKALTVDATGTIVLVPSVANDVNIYNSNGNLSSNRTVTLGGRSLTFAPSTANSQIFFNGSSGFVGLGTTSPVSRLDVRGALNASQGFMASTQSNGATYTGVMDRNDKCLVFSAGSLIGSGPGYVNTRMMSFFDFPQSNMDAKAVGYFSLDDKSDKNRYRFIYEQDGYTLSETSSRNGYEIMKLYEDGTDKVYLQLARPNSKLVVGGFADYAPGLTHKLVVKEGSALIEGNVLSDGNVGIGTSNFTDGSDTYRLSVNGSVRAHRVKVYTTWADYVFEDDYELPTLKEVAQYIKENGHLKDIPSASQVEKEGIELGEMNKLLLQKIEELTLYVIELNEKVEILEAEKATNQNGR